MAQDQRPEWVTPWLSILLVLVTTVVWVGSWVATILVPDFTTPAYVHLAFLGALGVVLGVNFIGRGFRVVVTPKEDDSEG